MSTIINRNSRGGATTNAVWHIRVGDTHQTTVLRVLWGWKGIAFISLFRSSRIRGSWDGLMQSGAGC